MKKKIFVGNLSWKTSDDRLRAHFEACGRVVSAHVVADKATGRPKGFGFVEMEDEESASNAIRELNGKPLDDRPLRLSLAQERERSERPDRSEGGHRHEYSSPRSNYRSGPRNFNQ